jgi:hypothetical protein
MMIILNGLKAWRCCAAIRSLAPPPVAYCWWSHASKSQLTLTTFETADYIDIEVDFTFEKTSLNGVEHNELELFQCRLACRQCAINEQRKRTIWSAGFEWAQSRG